jgi:hypothetical protein
MNYVIAHGGGSREWPTREYTLADIVTRAHRDKRIIVDGYGRANVRNARTLLIRDRNGARPPVRMRAVEMPFIPEKPFGPRTQ